MQAKKGTRYTEAVIRCSECNGLGVTGWGPTAEACLECGGLGLVPHTYHITPVNILDKEIFDELFSDKG